MPKRIVYAPNVEYMSGDLCAPQKLEYARNNNQAYDSPMNQRNYARNYRGAYIARRLSQSGKNIFAVKGRSAVGMTPKAKAAMANLAGAGALYGAYIVSDKFSVMQSIWQTAQSYGSRESFRKFWFFHFYNLISNKRNNYVVTNSGGSVTILNPWVETGVVTITVKNSVLVRYWDELATNPMRFTIDNAKGVYHSGNKWSDIIASGYNVLNLSTADSKVTYYGLTVWHESNGHYVAQTQNSLPSTFGDGNFTTRHQE